MSCYFTEQQSIHLTSGEFVVQEIVGRGASSVVYRTVHIDTAGNRTEHLLKEYHPGRIPLQRDSSGTLHVINEKDIERFRYGLSRFEKGYRLQMKFREDPELKNVTSNIQGIYEGYGTKYIDMTAFHGSTYDKIEEASLAELLRRIKALTHAISCFHKKGYLYLDIKPENIFTIPETSELLMFFDFDSVVAKTDLQNPRTILSYTRSWAAPEQMLDGASSYISECTDLYSIGMVFFYKLTGRFPEEPEEHRSNAIYAFDTTSGLLANANEKTLMLLTDFFRHTICRMSRSRWQTADELIEALDELLIEVNQPETQATPVEKEPQDIGKQISKLSRTILVSAILICVSIACLAVWRLVPSVGKQVDRNEVEKIADNSQEENEREEKTENVQTSEIDTKINNVRPVEADVSDEEETGEPSALLDEDTLAAVSGETYVIDTIAYDLQRFRSLVVTNDGVVYYLDGDVISNSADSVSVNLASDFDVPLENGYLAYDPYHDIVYLLSGGPLSIYDISDLSDPELVLDSSISGIVLAYESSCTPQIAILADGSLLVPADLDGTYRIDLSHKRIVSFTDIYQLVAPCYAKVVGDNILKIRGGSLEASIIPVDGGQGYDIQLGTEAPDDGNAVCAVMDGVWFYAAGVGACQYDLEGNYSILIDWEKISIKDYQALDYTNIWSIAANKSGVIAFYDNTLKCIRSIFPE